MPDAGAGAPKIAGSPFHTDPGARSRLAPSVGGRALLRSKGAGQHPYDGLIVTDVGPCQRFSLDPAGWSEPANRRC
jgi:hypothetical protein